MKKKILIVDDEEDICSSIKGLVEDIGYEAETVSNGKQALAILQKKKFDLILLDILMPEMAGNEVLGKIRADPKLKNQKVAILTVVQLSKSGENILEKLKPIEYFQKPIDINDFERRLKKILR